MRILITGGNGQLGSELQRTLFKGYSELGVLNEVYKNAAVTSVDVDRLDITDMDAARSFCIKNAFDLIINCAAMTNVDACESDEVTAYRVNVLGARNIAWLAEKLRAKLVHVSTDYVFAGDSSRPYQEWDIPMPRTTYGKSKMLGERCAQNSCSRVFVVRTSWLYGYVGNNFVKTILKSARERGELKVVNDQRGNPTNAEDLAYHILKIAATEEYGVYHCTGKGECSWYDFANEILRHAEILCSILPCKTEEFPRLAQRPAYSSLDNLGFRSTIGDEMRDWKEAIAAYMEHYDKSSGKIII